MNISKKKARLIFSIICLIGLTWIMYVILSNGEQTTLATKLRAIWIPLLLTIFGWIGTIVNVEEKTNG